MDLAAGGTPTSAARFNDQESGIFNVDYRAAARVFHSASQSITSGVATALAFNSERFDQENNAASTIHDTATNNSRLTCRTAGVYLISAVAEWAASPVNGTLRLRVGGATEIARQQVVGDYRVMCISSIYALNVNDYVEVVVSQASGGAVNINSTANYSPEFSMVLVA